MALPLEHFLRDTLATQLDVLEPGLKLVSCEFPLPNSVGSRGSIDILARDRHGLWVVIELKRSRTAARQALHEVAKYTELLCREKHLHADRIRAIIVSTDWTDLLVPASNIARDWMHDLRGYQLHVDTDGSVAGADRVRFLPRSFEHEVSPIHVIFLFDDAESRDSAWQLTIKMAAAAGAHDLLAADFLRVADTEAVVAPYGLYLAIGKIDPAMIPGHGSHEQDGVKSFAEEYPAEHRALCHITARVRPRTMQSAAPGLLRQIADNPSWKIEGYRATGSLGSSAMHDDNDCFRALVGDDAGQGQFKFAGSANPQMRTRWQTFSSEVRTSLGGNQHWEALIPAWLDRMARDPEVEDISLDIFNPCDLFGALYHGWPDKLGRMTPLVLGGAARSVGTGSFIRGGLFWDGWEPRDVSAAIESVYPDTISWDVAGYGGMRWMSDGQLLDQLGLRYGLMEFTGELPITPGKAEQAFWFVHGDRPQRFSPKQGSEAFADFLTGFTTNGRLNQLPDFLETHRHELNALVTRFRNESGYAPSTS